MEGRETETKKAVPLFRVRGVSGERRGASLPDQWSGKNRPPRTTLGDGKQVEGRETETKKTVPLFRLENDVRNNLRKQTEENDRESH